MNATSVRVRFTLPQILVGLVGHAELIFTTQPTLPRHEWNVQKFARPKRLFDTPNIEYHLSNLKPETTYYFQIRIIVEALQSGPESEIYKIRMPSEIVSSTTTLRTTTTLPPTKRMTAHVTTSMVPGRSTSLEITHIDPAKVGGSEAREKITITSSKTSTTSVPPSFTCPFHPVLSSSNVHRSQIIVSFFLPLILFSMHLFPGLGQLS